MPQQLQGKYQYFTQANDAKLREAGCSHVTSIHRLFLEHFTPQEIDQLASLLRRLPGAAPEGSCTVE